MKFKKHLPLIALCLGFFMVIMDMFIVNVALPTMAKELHGGVADLQWVVDGYTLTFACLLLSAGNLGDRLGARGALVWGLILFAATSLFCGLASNFEMLIIFRFLQGAAAALLVPTSLALINAAYENKQQRAHAIGIWAAVGGLAGASGPVLGAILTAYFSWRAVFFVNLPIALVAILLTLKYVPNPISHDKSKFDAAGQISGIISIAALAFSLIEAGRLGWFSGWVLLAFGIFIITAIIFLIVERQNLSPMLPLSLFKSKIFSTAIAVALLLNIGAYGTLFMLPLYFQQVREYSTLMTGMAIFPRVSLIMLASYLAGKMASRIGPKLPMMLGLMIGAAGFLMLLIADQTVAYWLLILPLVIIGFGIGFTMPGMTIAVINAAPENRAGIASGALNASRQIGSLIGVAVFGTILNSTANFIFGMHIGLIIAGTIYLFGCLITLLFVSQRESAIIKIP